MDDPGGPYRIGLALLFLLFSALFSSAETAIFAAPKHLLGQLKTGKIGARLEDLLAQPERTLSTILIGNTLVNVFFTSSITAIMLSTMLPRQTAEFYSTILAFSLLLLLGEVLPKTFASQRPLAVLQITIPTLYAWYRAFTPLSFLLAGANAAANRLFPPETDVHSIGSEDIISSALREGQQRGGISEDASRAIKNIFATDNTPIRKVMTPRKRIYALEQSQSITEAANLMMHSGYSRIPVYEGRLDHLEGIIYMKDLLMLQEEHVELADIVRPVLRIDASDSVERVLKQMRQEQTHMAAVYNSDQRLIGIVTIEDLLEEIVGEIIDEHDTLVAGEGF